MVEQSAELARFDNAWRGVFESRESVESGPWTYVSRAHRFHAGLAETLPTLEDIASVEGLAEPHAISFGAYLVGRACILRFDRAGFDRALQLMESTADNVSAGERAQLYLRVMRGWQSVLDGAGDDETLKALATACSQGKIAELTIEANVLRTFALLQRDDLSEATALARRVSRMARAEGMPQQEYLAYVCLALVRRRAGHTHLATRILAAIEKVAPPVWRCVLDWQMRLCGQIRTSPTAPASAIDALFQACTDGDKDGFDKATRTLKTATLGFYEEHVDGALLAAALDPRGPIDGDLNAWATGDEERLPRGLHAIAADVPNPHAQLSGHSWVYAPPSGAARRFLHPGIGLVLSSHRRESTRRRHGRTELATSVLALAGTGGIHLTKFVPRVYGFAYSGQAHDGVLRVLLHRMRKNLVDIATISRDDDRLTMVSHASFVVPDPRTSEPSNDHILRAIAAHPGTSAKDIAKALAVPLRTVQAALTTLVADGACLVERVGPGMEYRLEDTTFSEPTTTHTLEPKESA